ncbi:MAG: hypothetical protein A3H35_18240 [Betaproteobacteria bacterium RIFCSPLOWO2_02_FULL_62_17]|nr:MAG: hypothetical protein A3H35_18240 [Betaproteobacteria bacterium RIFCSPLOWO2_02_FULL_62_17]
MVNDAGGREKLLAFGVRTVPVVAHGEQFVFAQNLEDVAEFVGLQGTGHTLLPPDQLIGKWINVLRALQRYMRQMPEARIEERVIDNRDRSIRVLSHHVFRITEAFLECVVDGIEYSTVLANAEPASGTFTTCDQIVAYGDDVIVRLQRWWDGLAERSCQQKVKTFFGMQPVHMLFERSTWHTAQHARQLIAVLERFGIVPDGRLTPADLAGLPLPEGLWE